jgi:hypothetical protein
MGPPAGLTMSTAHTTPQGTSSKSKVHIPPNVPWTQWPIGCGIEASEGQDQGFVFLGAPIGPKDFQANYIRDTVQDVKDLTDSLPLIMDAHAEFALIWSCFALPKVMYVLRTVDSEGMDGQWQHFDDLMRDSFSRIIAAPTSDSQWRQASLPTTMGGLGFRSPIPHASGAFLCSVTGSALLAQQFTQGQGITKTLDFQKTDLATRMATPIPEDQLLASSQKSLSLQVDLNLKALCDAEATSPRDKVRVTSLTAPHTGDWLNVVPLPVLGLHLRPVEFKYAVSYRLGIPLYQDDGTCPACGRASDRFGDHSLATSGTISSGWPRQPAQGPPGRTRPSSQAPTAALRTSSSRCGGPMDAM